MAVIVGIDEVGRGCWAGPVVAAAVVLHAPIAGLADSKVLSKKKRDMLAEIIHSKATVGLGWANNNEVDALGLTAAVRMAMDRALEQLAVQQYDEVIIDGSYNFLAHVPKTKTMVKGDMLIPAISAASIVAKVARDNYMAQKAQEFAVYGFDMHVGYGTRAHQAALRLHGPCALHRRSFAPVRQVVLK